MSKLTQPNLIKLEKFLLTTPDINKRRGKGGGGKFTYLLQRENYCRPTLSAPFAEELLNDTLSERKKREGECDDLDMNLT